MQCDLLSKTFEFLFHKNTLPDTIFSIEHLNNPKNLLEKIFNKEIPIPYAEDENAHWDRLRTLIEDDYTTFKDFVKKHFKVTSLSIFTLLQYWLKTDDCSSRNWPLKHFVLSQ